MIVNPSQYYPIVSAHDYKRAVQNKNKIKNELFPHYIFYKRHVVAGEMLSAQYHSCTLTHTPD